jgi:hypothetical protein
MFILEKKNSRTAKVYLNINNHQSKHFFEVNAAFSNNLIKDFSTDFKNFEKITNEFSSIDHAIELHAITVKICEILFKYFHKKQMDDYIRLDLKLFITNKNELLDVDLTDIIEVKRLISP